MNLVFSIQSSKLLRCVLIAPVPLDPLGAGAILFLLFFGKQPDTFSLGIF